MQQFVQCGGGRTGRTPTHRRMRRSRPDSILSALIESRVRRGAAHQAPSPGLGAFPKALNEPAPECNQDSFSMMHLVSQQCSPIRFDQECKDYPHVTCITPHVHHTRRLTDRPRYECIQALVHRKWDPAGCGEDSYWFSRVSKRSSERDRVRLLRCVKTCGGTWHLAGQPSSYRGA